MGQRPGRPPAGPPGGSAGARGAMLLVVAVVLGIVLLQQFDSGVGTGRVSTGADTTVPAAGDDSTTTTRRPTLTSLAPTTTVGLRPKSEVTVLVANGAGVRGLGASTTATLKNLGYATLTPVDATSASIDKTAIHYAEGFEGEAREVASALSQPPGVLTRLNSPPVASVGEAKVVVILGLDFPAPGGSTTGSAPGPASTTSTTRG